MPTAKSAKALPLALALTLRASAQPVPQPFPKPDNAQTQPPPTAPKPVAPPGTGAAKPTASDIPTEASLGLPIYPSAQFLNSYDAGRGQRFYLFGSAASFDVIVVYYKTFLKQKGELVFEDPPTHMFEVGKFKEETMAFPPGITVKDFTAGGSAGYPNPKPGAQPTRFKTIIQIVPVTGGLQN
jgi:hypothetical protein